MMDTNYELIKILISVLPKDIREAFMEKANRHVEPGVRWLTHEVAYTNIGGLEKNETSNEP